MTIKLKPGCELALAIGEVEKWNRAYDLSAMSVSRAHLLEVIRDHIRKAIAEGNRYEQRMLRTRAAEIANEIMEVIE